MSAEVERSITNITCWGTTGTMCLPRRLSISPDRRKVMSMHEELCAICLGNTVCSVCQMFGTGSCTAPRGSLIAWVGEDFNSTELELTHSSLLVVPDRYEPMLDSVMSKLRNTSRRKRI